MISDVVSTTARYCPRCGCKRRKYSRAKEPFCAPCQRFFREYPLAEKRWRMSTLGSAGTRARPLSQISRKHQREICTELAEWDFVFTGFKGGGSAVMEHPLAGVVQVHSSPSNPSGVRKSCLQLARKLLAAQGIEVVLPWRPQPKKEQEVTAMEQTAAPEKKVVNGQKHLREIILNAYRAGVISPRSEIRDIVNTLTNRGWVLPHYPSADANVLSGTTATQQSLRALRKDGLIEAESEIVSGQGQRRSGRRTYYSLASFDGEAGLTPAEVPSVESHEDTETQPEPVAPVPVHPAPSPDEESAEPLTESPVSGLPDALVDALRSHFVGDMEAENQLLREALAAFVAAADNASALLDTLETVAPGRRAQLHTGAMGKVREDRLERIVEQVPHDADLHYTKMAELIQESPTTVNGALSPAANRGWVIKGLYRIERRQRGYYRIVQA